MVEILHRVTRPLDELVASFQECTHCPPWPWGRPRAVAECGAVSKRRDTLRQRVGWKAHEHRTFCSCTPEMYEPHKHTFSPHVSRGYADQQNSQPVKTLPSNYPQSWDT